MPLQLLLASAVAMCLAALLLTLLAILAQDHTLTLADPRLAAVFTNYKIGHAPVAMASTSVVTLDHLDLSLLVLMRCKNEPTATQALEVLFAECLHKLALAWDDGWCNHTPVPTQTHPTRSSKTTAFWERCLQASPGQCTY